MVKYTGILLKCMENRVGNFSNGVKKKNLPDKGQVIIYVTQAVRIHRIYLQEPSVLIQKASWLISVYSRFWKNESQEPCNSSRYLLREVFRTAR